MEIVASRRVKSLSRQPPLSKELISTISPLMVKVASLISATRLLSMNTPACLPGYAILSLPFLKLLILPQSLYRLPSLPLKLFEHRNNVLNLLDVLHRHHSW